MPPLHTALDAPSLVFFPPAGTCSLNRIPDTLSVAGTRWREKSCAIIASPSEKCGLALITAYYNLTRILRQWLAVGFATE